MWENFPGGGGGEGSQIWFEFSRYPRLEISGRYNNGKFGVTEGLCCTGIAA